MPAAAEKRHLLDHLTHIGVQPPEAHLRELLEPHADGPTAEPMKVKQELLSHEVVLEEFGGEVLSAEVSAKTAAGDITIDDAQADVTAHSASGDIELGRFSGNSFNAKTLSGDVRLGVTSGRTFAVSFQSLSGDVRTDFPISTGEHYGLTKGAIARIDELSEPERTSGASPMSIGSIYPQPYPKTYFLSSAREKSMIIACWLIDARTFFYVTMIRKIWMMCANISQISSRCIRILWPIGFKPGTLPSTTLSR